MIKEEFVLSTPDKTIPAVRKDRKNATCDMQAWYYETGNNTYAFARLIGAHGVRENIPADRKYFISAGEGVFIIDGNEHPVAKGSLVAIPKGSTYNFHTTGTVPLEFFVDIGFKLDFTSIPSK